MRTPTTCLALAFVLLLPFTCPLWGQPDTHVLNVETEVPAGPVSGVWTLAGSPYHVNGTVTIPNDSTLIIEPGVEVVFMGHYKLNVEGRLLAIGSFSDSIRFRAVDTQTGWHGIRFVNTPNTNDTSKIVYCVLRNGKGNTGTGFDRCGGAMLIAQFDKVLVSNCLFDSNMQTFEGWNDLLPQAGPAIYIYHASPTISQSTFTHHVGSLGSAISCLRCPHPIISRNVFTENLGMGGPVVAREIGSPIISGNAIYGNIATYAAGGIAVEAGATPRIENNIIVHNRAPFAGGIWCASGTNVVLLNNTIAYNTATDRGGGIDCDENTDAILINNILYGNTAAYGSQVNVVDVQSDPVFLYCNIQGGKAGFAGTGAGANYTGLYKDNIVIDPLFVNAAAGDFRLSDSSQCIGSGIDSIEISGVWYYSPLFAFGGNVRPNPAGSRPDIGAWESILGYPVTGLRYPHDVRLSRCGRDTLRITARLENPLAHAVVVTGTLTAGTGALIDSVFLKDDGLHGDGTSADGFWGCHYVPKKDDTINVTIRKDDLTAGASLTLPTAATCVFTRGPILSVDTRTVNFRQIANTLQSRDTTFMVRNVGYAEDSVYVTLDYVNVTPDSAIAVSPVQFVLAAGDSAKLTFLIRPQLLVPQYYYALVLVQSRFGFADVLFSKSMLFQVVVGTNAPASEELPGQFALDQNYPNPFNPSTTITYAVPTASEVKLSVYDMLGREVSVLVNDRKDAGVHEVQFEASGLSSGMYFYRLQSGDLVQSRKLTLLK